MVADETVDEMGTLVAAGYVEDWKVVSKLKLFWEWYRGVQQLWSDWISSEMTFLWGEVFSAFFKADGDGMGIFSSELVDDAGDECLLMDDEWDAEKDTGYYSRK